MFRVGDKVVYPMHGAGVIESIEERDVFGRREPYYVMRLPFGDMKVMIPANQSGEARLRGVIPPDRIEQVLQTLKCDGGAAMNANWNRRYRANLEKMRTGDIFEVAEVVRNLSQRDRDKGLSTGERKMLDSARQILISELVLAQGTDQRAAADLIERTLAGG